jgi:hypothetical protein
VHLVATLVDLGVSPDLIGEVREMLALLRSDFESLVKEEAQVQPSIERNKKGVCFCSCF